jgi:hypothetical protein
MLNIGQGFFVLVKNNKNEISLLNSFFPENMNYEPLKVHNILKKARHSLNQWYDTYYKDHDASLSLGIGTFDSLGNWVLESNI